ncbi:shikimate dehydrogenase [Peptostreptococcus russellii]|uniref:shikimate dehydrogenase n=1 Tax=Peptostreptococcus russellii TaxID=215200 RepID=UPI00162A21F5|nr:shikimate dehydrogenase [Peptostreptococcus russellii]MBC2578394.1 shikimate dehydrogenase [Peptostreptococcus russellii]
MKKHGLFGEGLSHSLSPLIHTYVYDLISYDADYSLIDFEKEALEKHINLLRDGTLNGVNVTMPYKKSVIEYLDNLDTNAREIDAVNTIVRSKSNLKGFNTDYYGIEKTLEKYMPVEDKTFLILGYGGASKPLIHFLSLHNAEKIYIASRSAYKYKDFYKGKTEIIFISYHKLDDIKASIVFNTTPLGMYPHIDSSPLDEKYFKNFQCAIDFIYNPYSTLFLQRAKKYGLKVENGLKMLVYQAIRSIELWSNTSIEDKIKTEIYLHFRSLYIDNEKIYLVGLPGSGKSTFGKMLSDSLGYNFVDLDDYIEKKENMKINDIFRLYGEVKFRELESQALRDLESFNKIVIATGGGSILRKENRELLKKHSKVFFIDRSCENILKDLKIENRPLLKDSSNRIFSLYNERKSFYEEVSDYVLDNSSSLEVLLEKTLKLF